MINSKEYWNDRFKTNDWANLGGKDQTNFFYKLAINNMPNWLIDEIETNNFSIIDIGCATGEGTDLLKRKFNRSEVTGIDFSFSAIEKAKEKYKTCSFQCKDIDNIDSRYDIIFCSNVLEHFINPFEKMRTLSIKSQKYFILLLPFQELDLHEEHFINFDYNSFSLKISDTSLCFYKIIDTQNMENSMWRGKQILLVYSNDNYISSEKIKLSRLHNGDFEMYNNMKSINQNLEKEIELLKIEDELILSKEHEELNRKYEELNQKYKKLNDDSNNQIKALNEEISKNIINIQEKDTKLMKTRKMCYELAETKSFKLMHLASRIKRQFVKGNIEEKSKFIKWSLSRFKNVVNNDHRYNPIYRVINILEYENEQVYYSNNKLEETKNIKKINSMSKNLVLEELSKEYKKYDVIILSIIDYSFRFQRPQHFADRFAKDGHRVFYINANYDHENSISQIKKNMYSVKFKNKNKNSIYATDWSEDIQEMQNNFNDLLINYFIKDAIVIVDYPNWVNSALYLNEQYGFKIITDYMDDFTGFLNPEEELVKKNCINLLQNSDFVIASSNFLYNIAKKYTNKVDIIRNGTEFTHFNSAINCTDKYKERKIIGYYGAVSHWFDFDKICYIAENLPECDIVIIGEVTHDSSSIEKYKNVKLLGEIKYKDLPMYLKEFDVCLIPFDTSTDLIKATNPVKFYEYLSAGKKIVATEIPELDPFKDKYVYLANDNSKFLKYVKDCLANNDNLANKEECIEFARQNDWNFRYNDFKKNCEIHIPKVSIIVLTYNNLRLNKNCIDSIINKTAYPNYELIIVDNLSTDGTREYLKALKEKNIKNTKIILNNENFGFAAGNNIGISESIGDYIVLLNNDTIVTRGWLTSLAKHLENNPKAGMSGPVTNSIGNEAKIKVDYNTKENLDIFAHIYTMTNNGKIFENHRMLALFCTMIKREVIEKCGLLDDSYEVGMFEDDDYSEAVKHAGYEIILAEDAFIHHYEGASFKKIDKEKYKIIFEKNKKKYENKWNKQWIPHKYRQGIDWKDNMDKHFE